MSQPPEAELLPEPHGAEREHGGSIGLTPPEEHEARASASNLREHGPPAAEGGHTLEGLPHRQEYQTALLGLVDDLERNPGASLDPIEKGIDVAGLANRAGRHRSHAAGTVTVDDVPEVIERRQRGVDGLRLDGPGRKGVASQQDAARRLLDDADRSIRSDLRDDEANGAGAHVEDRHQVGRRCGSVIARAREEGTFAVCLFVSHNVRCRLTIAKTSSAAKGVVKVYCSIFGNHTWAPFGTAKPRSATPMTVTGWSFTVRAVPIT
jgi:hypothetical protein